MKRTLLFLQLLFIFQLCCIAQKTDFTANPLTNELKHAAVPKSSIPVTHGWQAKAQQYIAESEYFFRTFDDQYAAANRKQKIAFTAVGTVFTIYPMQYEAVAKSKQWNSSIELLNIKKQSAAGVISQTPVITSKNDHLLFKYEGFKIEYLNTENGLRQNFLIDSKPDGNEKLQVSLKIKGDLIPSISAGGMLVLTDKQTGKSILKYDDLKVWDADKKLLPASMELHGENELVLVVDDANAVYPVTVDPLTHAAEWTTSANGILPALLTNFQLQVDAIYGFNVAGLGDVNGDGFDDIAVGAPGCIDIIAGPTTIAGAGAVFVYFGSATGPSTTPDKVLRATTPIANALFGFSIAGGNVVGNVRNDIIVGAPGESYTATVGGLPTTATVTAGKVYVFRGEDLSAAGNPSPFLSVSLNGAAFFDNGFFGILASNIAINALFGFSVAATEDMNGDGLGEVIVGSPGYAAASILPLLPVRVGTALVYYSTNLATNTPTQLVAPTAALLGIPVINTNGLLFGFSVDGLGDYNQDGQKDVIVGAPAGANLVPPTNLLGGSAYIYTGTGAGVNTTYYAHLRATPSLIGTVANLFGYSVRGVRDANAVRNGNVLVGAPSGNVLSNVIGALRLKTGTVNVFTSTNVAPNSAGELPDQSFSSPRGNSLLSILFGQNLDVSALFGASIDNMLDVNCDGINDIIVGEPLSTGVGIINTNAVGGAVNIFLGKANGTYQTTTFWALENNTDVPFGINAASLLGYSVAGARHVRGPSNGVRALIGAPGAMLDFSTGIFNLGATFGTLFGFVAGNNGLGKAYLYGYDNCGLIMNPDVNITWVNVPMPGNVQTNDVVPPGTTFGTPVPNGGNPPGGSITMNPDGTYTFTSTTEGVFYYQVPVCIPGQAPPCPTTELKITVLNGAIANPPVANTDIATTKAGIPVTLSTLSNDNCTEPGCSLNPASVVVTVNPSNGTTSVNTVTGDITYTPNPGFTGRDTLTYQVCDNGSPVRCATAQQIITVNATGAVNATNAADDYAYTQKGISVSGNVKLNDTDPEGNAQTVTAQVTTISGVGTLTLNADGSFTFVPVAAFSGPVDFPYTTCDNGTPQACASATLYILVNDAGPLPIIITNFAVSAITCAVVVQWNFSNQINGDFTEVEQSTNGTSFSTVYKINFTGSGSGSFSVNIPQLAGNGYYRLKITDKDGKYRYSETKFAKTSCGLQEKLEVYPTLLVVNTMVLYTTTAAKGIAYLTLVDVYGRKLISQPVNILQGNNRMSINSTSLSKGAYFVRIEGKDWKSETVKVIKE
ncbi:MAG: Ig-like domain-containing protein [Ferruginibacter sp.]